MIVQRDYRCPRCRAVSPKGEALFALSQMRNLSTGGNMLRRPPEARVICTHCNASLYEEEIISGLHDVAPLPTAGKLHSWTKFLWIAIGIAALCGGIALALTVR